MPTTKVINGTDKPLTLKEGTAGIFTTLKKLQPQGSYQIVVDTNATYREYWCAVKADDPDGGVVLSSDDCEDLKQVTIIENKTEKTTTYSYEGVKRESGETITEEEKILEETSEPTKVEEETTKHGGLLTRLFNFFKRPEKGSSSKSPSGDSDVSSAV